MDIGETTVTENKKGIKITKNDKLYKIELPHVSNGIGENIKNPMKGKLVFRELMLNSCSQ